MNVNHFSFSTTSLFIPTTYYTGLCAAGILNQLYRKFVLCILLEILYKPNFLMCRALWYFDVK